MNKKFFAALASATMAFTASGSIAVFADDFVEEKTPVINNGQVAPKPTKVLWNKENFGDLAIEDLNKGTVAINDSAVKFDKAFKLDEKGYVETKKLEEVKGITFDKFDGEIKGLEYFTGLKTFNDNVDGGTSATKITNTTLDFSANTALTEIKVNTATDLTKIVLPNPTKTEEDLDKYVLGTLNLQETQLKSLDLSAYYSLNYVAVANNENLTEVALPKRTSLQKDEKALDGLNLSNNALETVNLDNYTIKNELLLNDNHIGALDLSKTKVNGTVNLSNQTFYVSETLENVNLAETFENFDKEAIAEQKDVYSQKTGVLTLKGVETPYEYETNVKNNVSTKLGVKLEKANPMNRLYNPNSGEHFYTADINEKEALVKLGWNDEGYGWVAPRENKGKAEVYRLYNPNAGDHHYTMSTEERDTLVAYGWKFEGAGWKSAGKVNAKPVKDESVAVYRQYNPYANGAGAHNYTTDKAENDYLVSLGWTPEGTAWLALQ